ncbi:MAG: hypothetical protein H6834_17130, partial [Planctomycetes bacterium]|nr:hypothetical protein [Planctomycetota bacterium]
MDTLRRLASVGTKLSSLLVLCVVTRAQPTGTRELEDITFVVPANWVTEDIQGVPNLKA